MDDQTPRTLDPWERQPYDTPESWPAFVAFRDQSHPRRARYLTVNGRPVDPIKVAFWMEHHWWEARVAEYDRKLDAMVRKIREDLLAQSEREVAAEYMEILADSRSVIRREMAKLLATSQESQTETVRVDRLTRLMEASARMDRLFRGESTAKIDLGPDLSNLSDEELDRRERLILELEGQHDGATRH